jgi:hypothetical protein
MSSALLTLALTAALLVGTAALVVSGLRDGDRPGDLLWQPETRLGIRADGFLFKQLLVSAHNPGTRPARLMLTQRRHAQRHHAHEEDARRCASVVVEAASNAQTVLPIPVGTGAAADLIVVLGNGRRYQRRLRAPKTAIENPLCSCTTVKTRIRATFRRARWQPPAGMP